MMQTGLCSHLKPIVLLAVVLLVAGKGVAAQDVSPLHPPFPILDANGDNVLDSGQAASTMRTCGSCHDTTFIEEHSLHANRSFEGWNPLTYQLVDEDTPLDEWIMSVSARHTGGGMASDFVEMNCFMCHVSAPNNEARVAALLEGNFAWANSATLVGTGIIEPAADGYAWNADAFDAEGNVLRESIAVQDPTSQNCGQCHGVVHTNAQIPLELDTCDRSQMTTITTGQLHSPQRLSNTGLNLQDKETLTRSWDVHAERVLQCNSCHYAQNNPVFFAQPVQTQPEHLEFDPRRMDFGVYLYRPIHQFAGEADTAMRTCESCHSMESTHEWLPSPERHIEALACESCHVPQLYAPALGAMDWTVLSADGQPRREMRGIEVCGEDETPFIIGFAPVLLSNDDGRLAPHNLITFWYWQDADQQPVSTDTLQAALFDGVNYAEAVLTGFDTNEDGDLNTDELRLDTDAKADLVAARLTELGVDDPQIVGEVRAYEIHHNITTDEWAIRECSTCHAEASLIDTPFMLTENIIGGTFPVANGSVDGASVRVSDTGALIYDPHLSISRQNLYIFGRDSVFIVDVIGVVSLLGVFAVVLLHGGLRFVAARRRVLTNTQPEMQRVYMYSVYERQWHWLQSLAIFLLLFTGLVIHKPHLFGVFSFRYIVQIHNILGFILILNAALAAFYHFVSGEIRQYIPQPHGLFDRMFEQIKFYIWGIFRGWPHPFDKSPERKLNPLQQMTYLMILNVLLPLQVITGILMWGAARFSGITERFGGLVFLAPLHTLVAWLFASFIVLHIYLTATGHEPLANIKAMMLGWDQVESHGEQATSEGSVS